MQRWLLIGIAFAVIIVIVAAVIAFGFSTGSQPEVSTSSGNSTIRVVAAENFWGSLVSQLGGSHVQVLSIVSDPNADPHEYETNAADARAFASASYVIVNGAGYDDWALKLLAAGSHPNQKLLKVADLLGKKEGDNPHFWYSPVYVDKAVSKMYHDLVSIDPADIAYYRQQYASLNESLAANNEKISEIKQQFAGVNVAATEDIFVYLADQMGLNLVSPAEFMSAVAEGNDPPVHSVTEFQQLIENKDVALLVYNSQTITPLTENIKALAVKNGIPVVGISETIQPTNLSFQDWQKGEIVSIQNALKGKDGK